MDPLKALDIAIDFGMSDHHRTRRCKTLGSVIAAMSSAARESLAQLRPTDIANARQDVVALYVEPDPSRALKLRFDRRLRSV
jgi:hypothetical protein